MRKIIKKKKIKEIPIKKKIKEIPITGGKASVTGGTESWINDFNNPNIILTRKKR